MRAAVLDDELGRRRHAVDPVVDAVAVDIAGRAAGDVGAVAVARPNRSVAAARSASQWKSTARTFR